MDELNWVEEKIEKIIDVQNYNADDIRELLVLSCYKKSDKKILEYIRKNRSNENFFKILLDILLDETEDYSNDCRYASAYYIPMFDEKILKKYVEQLQYAQNYSILLLRPYLEKNKPDWLW